MKLQKKLYQSKQTFVCNKLTFPRWYQINEGDWLCMDYKMGLIFNMTKKFYLPLVMTKDTDLNDTTKFECSVQSEIKSKGEDLNVGSWN